MYEYSNHSNNPQFQGAYPSAPASPQPPHYNPMVQVYSPVYPAMPAVAVQQSTQGNGSAVGGLIFGIVSLLGWLLPLLGLIFPIVGIILSTRGRRSMNRGMAITGLVLSIIGLVLAMLMTLALLAAA